MSKLKDALAASKQEPIKGTPIQITKTNVLKVQYVILPIEDTSVSIMYRFIEPIPTIWQRYRFSYQIVVLNPLVETIKTSMLDRWLSMLNENGQPLPKKMKWMEEIKEVKLIECEIVPKVNQV